MAIVEFGLPQAQDLGELLDRITQDVRENPRVRIDLDVAARGRLVQAARGLTLKEAENVFARSLVTKGTLSGNDVDVVFSEKQQIIRKSGLLEYCDSCHELAEIAGMDALKDWFVRRGAVFTEEAAKYGLSAPRGVLLLGVQGCGKSLCAKSVAGLWKLPLLRLDLGRMFSSLVGSSEENIRRRFRPPKASPAILWIARSTRPRRERGLGQRRWHVLAGIRHLLTWMSKAAPVFVIATANEIHYLPPELAQGAVR
jgi:hypothetical protein